MKENKPHILFLASWYPTREKSTHGIFVQQHALALSLYASVSVVYACAGEPTKAIECVALNANCKEYRLVYKRSHSFLKPVIHYWRARQAYKKLFNHVRRVSTPAISAIQLNVIFPTGLFLNLAKTLINVPYTVVEHWSGYLPEDGNYKGVLKKWLTKQVVKKARVVFHVSEPMRKAMLNHGLTGNYQLLYNVVNTSLFKPGIKSERPLLIHVSSLVEREKNRSGLLLHIQQLQKKGYDFDTLIIGGEDTELQLAMEQAKHLQLKAITFTGIISLQELCTHLQKAWALLLFSHFEGMPVVALEALACGVPVLANKVGHLPYLITPNFGILTEVNHTAQQQLAIENILTKAFKSDSQELHNWVKANASYEAVGKQLLDHYL